MNTVCANMSAGRGPHTTHQPHRRCQESQYWEREIALAHFQHKELATWPTPKGPVSTSCLGARQAQSCPDLLAQAALCA